MASVTLVIELLVLIAQAVPKVTPAVKDILAMLKGEKVPDITQEELELRVDAAIARLPIWE
jgi:hypothetical protein